MKQVPEEAVRDGGICCSREQAVARVPGRSMWGYLMMTLYR
jgi:hypothetical protein